MTLDRREDIKEFNAKEGLPALVVMLILIALLTSPIWIGLTWEMIKN